MDTTEPDVISDQRAAEDVAWTLRLMGRANDADAIMRLVERSRPEPTQSWTESPLVKVQMSDGQPESKGPGVAA